MDNSNAGADERRNLDHVADLLTLDDVAARLGLERDEVYRLVRCGDLLGVYVPEQRQWYVQAPSVDTYVAANS